MSAILDILEGWVVAIIAVIIGAVMNLVAITFLNAIQADWYSYALLVVADIAALVGIVKALTS